MNQVLKEFVRYTSFNVAGMLGLSCYILADTFFIAKGMGADGLAALNLAIPVYSFVNGSGLMMGMGGGTRYSIFRGQKGNGDLIFTQTLMGTLGLAAVFVLLGLFGSQQLTELLGAEGRVAEMTHTYLKVILLFAPMFMMNNLLLCFVRNDGDPGRSMRAMIGGSLSNVVLDYIFIFPLDMGIFGAVLATGLAPVISMCILSGHLRRADRGFHIRSSRPSAGVLKTILSLGFPSLVAEVSSGIVIIVFNMLILKLEGNTGIAAYGVIANLSLVAAAVFTGIAQGIQPIVSRACGLGDKEQAGRILGYGLKTMAVLAAAIYLVLFFQADGVTAIFNSQGDGDLQRIAVEGLKVYFTALPFMGFNIVMASYFTSMDRALPAHLISILRGLVLILPVAFVLSWTLNMQGIWMAVPVTEGTVCLGTWLWSRRGGRKGKKHVSYIKRHFFYLFLMVSVLVCTMGGAVIHFSRKLVGSEIVKLHQALLKQSANVTADVLGEMMESLDNIAQNAGLTQWLAEEEPTEGDWGEAASAEAANTYVEGLIQDEIYKNYKRRSVFRIYIYDQQGLRYGSDAPVVSWEAVSGWIRQEAARGRRVGEQVMLKGPVRGEEAGLYRHSIYLLQPVRDLLDQEVEGYILMQFSEKVLYDTYSDLRGEERVYSIIDGNGILVSGSNKAEIGTRVQWDMAQPMMEEGEEYLRFYENILGTEWYLTEQINIHEIWNSLDRMVYVVLALLFCFVLCLFPLTIGSRRSILKPVDKIKDKMGQVAEGKLSVRIDSRERGEGEFAEIADSFNYMVDQLEKQVEAIREIEHKKHALELDFLQAQINPHFIYNTLSSIRFYVEMGKNEEAEDMLLDFSKILRKTLSHTEQMVSLREETETLKHYVNLQKARYRDRFQAEFQMGEETLTSLVPDFILQPIVENAIFYSLREGEMSHITIRSFLKDKDLWVEVEDDGVGMDQEKIDQAFNKDLTMNKVGIKNVNERLKLNFGEGYGIKIISQKGKGTRVILMMPSTAERKRRNEDIDRR